MDVQYAQACLMLKKFSSSEMVSLADAFLKLGKDIDAFKKILDIDKDYKNQIEEKLLDGLKALGAKPISKKEAGMILARHIAAKIVSGEIGPHEGARRIWWEVWNECGMPAELTGFVSDADDYEDSLHPDPKILERIVENAKKLLSEHPEERP